MSTKRSWALLPVLLLAASCAGSGSSGRPERDTVLLLHTNDTETRLVADRDGEGGMARIGGVVDRARAERPDVLLLDAGDAVTGTPASSLFEGRPVFHVMSEMGYDAMALGNHEFDHGFARIADYRRIATFPLLAANLVGPDGGLLADAAYEVIDVDGVRVGVIGVITPDTPRMTIGGATTGCAFEAAEAALARLVPEVEKRADLVVVLSHLGHDEDRELAAAVPGIDVIVGGHSHTELAEPDVVGGTLIVQAGHMGKRLGRLELTVDLRTGTVARYDGRLIRVDARLPESARVRSAVAVWEGRVAEAVDVLIGAADRDLGKPELRRATGEIYRRVLGADLGYQNPGGVRATIAAGPIRIRDVWYVLPFENTLVTVRVRGGALPSWAKERIGRVEPDRIYTVATNSYVADHPEQYFPGGVESVRDSGREMRGAVIDWVREHGGLPAR